MSRSLATLVAVFLALAAPLATESVTVETWAGPAEAPLRPETTFVYDMAALDTLDALGVEGITSIGNTYLDYLDEYEGEAGTLFEPDFEAIHAAQPELVILGGRSMEHAEMAAKLAPTLDMTIWGEDVVGQGLARLAAYGAIYDRAAEARALEAEIGAALDATRAAAQGRGRGLIVMTNGPKISVYGGGSRFGWLHRASGLEEAAAGLDETVHGQAVSFEFIREVDPDWLLVIDRVAAIGAEGTNAEATLDNPLVRGTRAWRTGQVVHLDAAPLYVAGGGVQSILGTLGTLREAFEAAGG